MGLTPPPRFIKTIKKTDVLVSGGVPYRFDCSELLKMAWACHWEGMGYQWEVMGGQWEVMEGQWEVMGSQWEVIGGQWEVMGDQ